MDEWMDSMDKETVYSTSNANIRYLQVEIESDRNKTTSTSQYGLLRFVKMPFGLENAPGISQQTMDIFMSTLKVQLVLVYFDDIIVLSRMPKQDIKHFREVLVLLQMTGVTLKLVKCT